MGNAKTSSKRVTRNKSKWAKKLYAAKVTKFARSFLSKIIDNIEDKQEASKNSIEESGMPGDNNFENIVGIKVEEMEMRTNSVEPHTCEECNGLASYQGHPDSEHGVFSAGGFTNRNLQCCAERQRNETRKLEFEMNFPQSDTSSGGGFGPTFQIKTENLSPQYVAEDHNKVEQDTHLMKIEESGMSDVDFEQVLVDVKVEGTEVQTNPVEPHTCEKCGKTYNGLESYEVHLEIEHGVLSASGFGNRNFVHSQSVSETRRMSTESRNNKCLPPPRGRQLAKLAVDENAIGMKNDEPEFPKSNISREEKRRKLFDANEELKDGLNYERNEDGNKSEPPIKNEEEINNYENSESKQTLQLDLGNDCTNEVEDNLKLGNVVETNSHFDLTDNNNELEKSPPVFEFLPTSCVSDSEEETDSKSEKDPLFYSSDNDNPVQELLPNKKLFENNDQNLFDVGPQREKRDDVKNNCIKPTLETGNKKTTVCKFCQKSVTNFERHLERHHKEEEEVIEFLSFPKNTRDGKNMRRKIVTLLRCETRLKEFIESDNTQSNRLPCIYCKKIVKSTYLRRHYTSCSAKPLTKNSTRIQHRQLSQTLLATSMDSKNTAATSRVSAEVFPKMKADLISLVAKKDVLIKYFGEHYLRKHKRTLIVAACSNKLRECARLLMEIRRRAKNEDLTFSEALSPDFFDHIVASAKGICGYDEERKKFEAPSLAVHLGTLLKQISDYCAKLIVKGVLKYDDVERKLKDVERFRSMVEAQWNCEVASLATKDLGENRLTEPVLLQLTNDVLQLKDYIIKSADENVAVLRNDNTNENAFRNLVDATLSLTILFNRRGIGDVQRVNIESYLKDVDGIDQTEFMEKLTESEKILTKSYKRVVATGKEGIVILFPKKLQEYVNCILEIRQETNVVPKENAYLFAYPHIKNLCIKADVVIRTIAEASYISNPEAISANRFRKQISTHMQIANVNQEDFLQLAKFMGLTEMTHKEFYEITQDAHPTVKISKLLNLFDKGRGMQFKGVSLNEIEMDSLQSKDNESENDLETQEDIDVSPNTIQELDYDTGESSQLKKKGTDELFKNRVFTEPEETSSNDRSCTVKWEDDNHDGCNLRNMLPGLKKRIKTCKNEKLFKCDVCNYTTIYKSHLKRHVMTHTGEKLYKCNVCDYSSIYNSHLKQHLMTHTGEKPYKCHVCQYSCIDKSHLKRHVMTHTGEKRYKCDVCDYSCIDKSNLKRHLMGHSAEKPLKCDVCEYSCIDKRSLKQHMMTHTEEKPYKCDVCDYSCINKSSLRRHVMVHSAEKPLECDVCDYNCTDKKSLKEHMMTHSDEKQYKCDVCDYSCVNKFRLKQHAMGHSIGKPYKCDVCDFRCLYKSNLKRHVMIHSAEKPLKCDVCDYSCIKKSRLKQHLMTHTGEKPYKCVICDYGCINKQTLKRHGMTHSGEKPFKCSICDYSCIIKSNFKQHIVTHTGEKPYPCDVCDYSFTTKSSLKRHLITHTGKKSFECDVCDYSCSTTTHLKQHMMTHTGEKPYKCDVCDYSCNDKSNLKQHLMRHTGEKPYKCDVCDYSFTIKASLKRHLITHTGTKPFECDVCDYSCITTSNLKQHMMTHTGEKPLKCVVCDYSCVNKSNLNRHMIVHSAEKPLKCDV